MNASDKKPVITAVRMLKSKGAEGGKICPKGQILKAGPDGDISHKDAFHFVAARHAENLTEVAKDLKKDKGGNWVLPGEKPAGAQGGDDKAGQDAKGGK